MCLGVFLLDLSCMGLSVLPGLDDSFLSHIRDIFNYNLFKYFLRPFFSCFSGTSLIRMLVRFFFIINEFIFYFCLYWVFVSVRGLSPVAVSGGYSSSRCAGLSLSWPLPLRSTGSRHAGSVVVAHGLSCSAACGIFPDQGLNPCPLHWQADS